MSFDALLVTTFTHYSLPKTNMTTYSVTFTPPIPLSPFPSARCSTRPQQEAGLDLNMPCGGQGAAGAAPVGRGAGTVPAALQPRLSADDGRATAACCQTVIEGRAHSHPAARQKIERRLVTGPHRRRHRALLDYDRRDQIAGPTTWNSIHRAWTTRPTTLVRVQRALRCGMARITPPDLGILRTLRTHALRRVSGR